MYSWRQRPDTTVVDEPWYARYLAVTGLPHPGAEAVIASQPTDIDAVVAGLVAPSERPVRFLKNMAHHIDTLDRSVLDLSDNYLLVRDPRALVPSLARALRTAPTLDQTGLPQQVAIVEHLARRGEPAPVVVSESLLDDPAGVTRRLCAALGLPYHEAMLSWPAGPKPEDGCWAEHWYASVHRSTGFEAPPPRPGAVAPELAALVDAARPLFDRLVADAI